uniref:Uncharacterized protein n=1 Tax=Biomphalaria glabrata TaxID=6526 RepID=A0A2C9M6V3_BIOGL
MFRTMSFFSFLAYFVIITVVYCASFDDCKETEIQVQLRNFDNKDCDTKCTKGLLLNDTIRLFGTITGIATEKVNDGDQVTIKRRNGGNDIDVDTLKNCISGRNKTYKCTFTISTINITYDERLRNTRNKIDVYLEVIYNNGVHCSKTIELPAIFDPSKVKLFVNAQNVIKSYQRIIVENSLLNFHCEDFIEPCDVYTSHSSLNMKNAKEINYTIGYSICGREYLNQYKVTVIMNTTDSDVCSIWNNLSKGLLVSFIIIIPLFIVLILMIKRLRP